MKITKAVIENFRCFNGLQIPIEFNTDGKITLIYGLSGSGKTTLLDFFNWVFYGKEPNEKRKFSENKPLYNIKSMEDLSINNELKVSGTIIFVSKEIEYKLIRERRYKKTYTSITPFPEEVRLFYRTLNVSVPNDNIGFIPYDKDPKNKINEVVPQALSKYFFFAGEDGGALASSDVNLESSIYSMFDLRKYSEAIRHLGDRTTSNSLLGYYYKEKASYKAKGAVGDLSKIYSEMVRYSEYRKQNEKKYNDYAGYIRKYTDELKELYKESGRLGGKSAETINFSIETNKRLITTELDNISRRKFDIGRGLANVTPYLLLCEKAVNVRDSLALEATNDIERRKKMNSFVDLGRPLLEDVKNKGLCICGRELDATSNKYIEDTLKLLPPSSYSLIFQQFVNNNKDRLYGANSKYEETISILTDILRKYDTIEEYSQTNKKLLDDLASLDKEKLAEIASRLRIVEGKIKEYEEKKRQFYDAMENGRRGEKKYSDDYDRVSKTQGQRNDLDEKIDLLKNLKTELELTLSSKKKDVKLLLEKSIKEVYSFLSTRVEDFSNKDFLNSNFSLRDEYKTGGQELIDVYSYIIGMVKALGETENKDSEFPVIVDAPFSKTDELQLAHVIQTMPKIVGQVAFFTFDKMRIKEFADTSVIGSVWELQSDILQENTIIRKGEL